MLVVTGVQRLIKIICSVCASVCVSCCAGGHHCMTQKACVCACAGVEGGYVVHVDNVLLFFLCGYLVKGKIPVRWSSHNLDYREGGL